ncbi:MAG: hypothetical protein CSA20_05765 [Deltaproteobacteria bacterium]|nr:MAG: hypothetical protein CSB23_03665 [Deltaproteobacteria bacterium]PIE72968.1 MAG: hypothetical protein CSA20_05765 [Deltaproteobacteria bacterium]
MPLKQSGLRVQGKRKRIWLRLLGLLLLCILLYLQYRFDLYAFITGFNGFGEGRDLGGYGTERGVFYDRKLQLFAVNMEEVGVLVRCREVREIPETAKTLAEILSVSQQGLVSKLKSGVLRFWAARGITEEQERQIRAVNLSGVYLKKVQRRYYPHGEKAAYLVGFVDGDVGLFGLELYYENILVSGRSADLAANGSQDLVLTVDLQIQEIFEELVSVIGKNENVVTASAYLMEAATGALIAGAQYPGFDPNHTSLYDWQRLENKFFTPFVLPEKFRRFLRDSALFYGQITPESAFVPWSLRPDPSPSRQIGLYEALNLDRHVQTDICSPEQALIFTSAKRRPVATDASLNFVPKKTTPIRLLSAFSSLLIGWQGGLPHAVNKVVSREVEAPSIENIEVPSAELINQGAEEGGIIQNRSELEQLFMAMSTRGDGSFSYFRDAVLVVDESTGGSRLLENDLTFVAIPALGQDLSMLILVQRRPDMACFKAQRTPSVVQLVDEKAMKISALYQVFPAIADVMQPESAPDENYRKKQNMPAPVKNEETANRLVKRRIMPDLRGLSLRKSLRLLDKAPVSVRIEGSGVVLRQEPPPGTPLVPDMECRLLLGRNTQ